MRSLKRDRSQVAHDTSNTVLPPLVVIPGKKKNKTPLSAVRAKTIYLPCVNTEYRQQDPSFFNILIVITSLQTIREEPAGLAFDK